MSGSIRALNIPIDIYLMNLFWNRDQAGRFVNIRKPYWLVVWESRQAVEQLFVVAHPADKLPNTVPHGNRRLPFEQLLRPIETAHKYWLISRPPVTPLQRDANVKLRFKVAEELEQRHSIVRSAADIEGLTAYCLAMIESCFVRIGQILHVKDVA